MNGGSGVSIRGVRILRVVENKQTYINLSNFLGYPRTLHPHFTYAPLSLRDFHSGFFPVARKEGREDSRLKKERRPTKATSASNGFVLKSNKCLHVVFFFREGLPKSETNPVL